MGSRNGVRPVSAEGFSRLWKLPRMRDRLRDIGFETPEHMVAQFMADASQLKWLAASIAPLVDNFPRRLSPIRRAARFDPLFAWLVDAGPSRERLEASGWAARVLSRELVARSAPRFRERGMLDEELFPLLQAADHSYWNNVALLLRQPGSLTWKRWMLGSEARKIEIARSKDATDPLVAEQLAVDALATGRKPERTMIAQDRFMAMTPKGQVLTILRHCLAGEEHRAKLLMAWIPQERRTEPPYRDFFGWAPRGCA
jgi:hypothetical protein